MNIFLQKPIKLAGVLILLLIILGPLLAPAQAGPDNSVITVHEAGFHDPVVALNSQGNPVLAVVTKGFNLGQPISIINVIRCLDPNCEEDFGVAGSPDIFLQIDGEIQFILDQNDHPVIAAQSDMADSTRLTLIYCNDPICEGYDEHINFPDNDTLVTGGMSLVLDSNGHPVISYFDGQNHDLKVMHCNDPHCAGDNESITSPDTAGYVGYYNSLALDSNGRPVIGYFDADDEDLRVMQCNDPNCDGGDEHVASPDTAGDVGSYVTLRLDSNDRPVISYLDRDTEDLNLMHCNDTRCNFGDESLSIFSLPPSMGEIYPFYHSMMHVLDSNGFPVISHGVGRDGLTVIHCNDANCEGDDESMVTVPVNPNFFTIYPSMTLDSTDHPVVSFIARKKPANPLSLGKLRLLHCSNPSCTPNHPPDCSKAVPSTEFLWPLNHGFHPIDILLVTDPDGDNVTIKIKKIYQDEPVTFLGDPTHPDGRGLGTSTAELRAEHSNPNGRVYTIRFRAKDGYGGECNGEVKVHALGFDIYAIEDQQLFDSTQSP